jgi:NADH-dependent peroxiredoxin subunit F
MSLYDLIIVGAGPAGITAAVYAARKRLRTLVLTGDIGGQAAWSSDIQNYTGFQFITGPELAQRFNEHLKSFDIKVLEGQLVECIKKEADTFNVKTKEGEYAAHTVVIATGRKPKRLGCPGETEYKNQGVTYCATCDAPLYSGKDVAVIGGGNSALDAALQLEKIAKKIYLIDISDRIIGDPIMLEKARESEKIQIMTNTEVREILGGKFVSGIRILIEKKQENILPVEGVFVEIGSTPVKEPACEAKLDIHGQIIVDERCQTSLPGLYAAGDVTNVPEKQIIVAAGQGCTAAIQAFKYLIKNRLTDEEKMDEKNIYKCNVCGNVVELLYEGGGELVCCGQAMEKLDVKTRDEGNEKHVPVIEKTDEGYLVKVGDVEHPMEEKHYIVMIELNAGAESLRAFLKPGQKPQARFCTKAQNVTAREYCNIHGLWKSNIE